MHMHITSSYVVRSSLRFLHIDINLTLITYAQRARRTLLAVFIEPRNHTNQAQLPLSHCPVGNATAPRHGLRTTDHGPQPRPQKRVQGPQRRIRSRRGFRFRIAIFIGKTCSLIQAFWEMDWKDHQIEQQQQQQQQQYKNSSKSSRVPATIKKGAAIAATVAVPAALAIAALRAMCQTNERIKIITRSVKSNANNNESRMVVQRFKD